MVTGFRGAEPIPGLPDNWHWSPAPAIDFAGVLSADGKRLLQLSGRNSYARRQRRDSVLGLLGFYDELDNCPGRPNGSVHDAVRPVGEPDEADLVAYLDAGHVLIDVMEGGHDVFTGSAHRHSLGCSSLVTDGTWLWRLDFPHYVETHHVLLPEAFIEHVRGLNHRMPALIVAQFAPRCDETLPLVGWASAVPWRSTEAVLEPAPRAVTGKAEFDAAILAQERNRPQGKWTKPRKPRRT